MKKFFSISLSLLMLAAMLHFTVATHYCGGKEVAMKVSLTGKLADCGMEGTEKKLPLPGTNFTKHCCDDVVAFCGIGSNYLPSFLVIPDSYQYNFQILSIPAGYSFHSIAVLKPLYTNVSPPGAFISTNVDLSCICVFRI